jgi:hypothetical protein
MDTTSYAVVVLITLYNLKLVYAVNTISCIDLSILVLGLLIVTNTTLWSSRATHSHSNSRLARQYPYTITSLAY